MIIKTDSLFFYSSDAAFRQINGEVIIVDTRQGRLLSLNETGSAIWSALDGRTVAQIAAELVRLFEVTHDEALSQSLVFLSELHRRGLVDMTAPTEKTSPSCP